MLLQRSDTSRSEYLHVNINHADHSHAKDAVTWFFRDRWARWYSRRDKKCKLSHTTPDQYSWYLLLRVCLFPNRFMLSSCDLLALENL